ncbi:flagellar FliJ family protein [Pelomonas sp. CA6]|uniref:flagellar FliJ family protein n=1 Tax=Pelomonas sp. CA6 TaxID=2907999 RepID=UPI001F4BF00C|nr:flagellar FliJ family protein [Pelomonas sp. CA6]MCH7345279.1 flagellar FliJ family protein [Pelomonas sp. CA6]
MSGHGSEHLQRSLGRLIGLQSLALERQQAQLAEQQRLCERVQGTVQRLEALSAQASLSGTVLPGLAQNGAAYKQAMLAWADQQRQELAHREAELALARNATLALARKKESLQQLLDRVDQRLHLEGTRREQKRQDDLALQAWGRR